METGIETLMFNERLFSIVNVCNDGSLKSLLSSDKLLQQFVVLDEGNSLSLLH